MHATFPTAEVALARAGAFASDEIGEDFFAGSVGEEEGEEAEFFVNPKLDSNFSFHFSGICSKNVPDVETVDNKFEQPEPSARQSVLLSA